jgi:hypothetical protein
MGFDRLAARSEWKFFSVLPKADRPLAFAWWFVLLLRGVLPAVFAVAMGVLIGAVQRGEPLGGPLGLAGVVFVILQILSPLHQAIGANLGSRLAAWLYDELATACVGPPGMGHLENPRLTTDLAMARDFDLGISGPPLSISMEFIASGLSMLITGLASALVLSAYAWWPPFLLAGAWIATHYLLRESAVWRDGIRMRFGRHSDMPTMRIAWRWMRRRRRNCGCLGSQVGSWNGSRPGESSCSICSMRLPDYVSGRCCGVC